MFGGFEPMREKYAAFFERHGIGTGTAAFAVDLGAGPGFQSIPLADAGFRVVAIDTSQALLDELQKRNGQRGVTTVCDDLANFVKHLPRPADLVVCMTDTLLHLPTKESVSQLFANVFANLIEGGRLVLTFRDLSQSLAGTARFIPVRSDDDRIFTCFVEYEAEHVNVHDLVYSRTDDGWKMHASAYPKLRLPRQWVQQALRDAGFCLDVDCMDSGYVTLIARKSGR